MRAKLDHCDILTSVPGNRTGGDELRAGGEHITRQRLANAYRGFHGHGPHEFHDLGDHCLGDRGIRLDGGNRAISAKNFHATSKNAHRLDRFLPRVRLSTLTAVPLQASDFVTH